MEQIYRGIPVSQGVAIGRVFVLDDVRIRIPRRTIAPNAIAAEQSRLCDAIGSSIEELAKIRDLAEKDLGAEAAKIFSFHLGMLGDASLSAPMLKRIEEDRVSAEYAAQEQFRILAELFAARADSTFQTKVDDVWDLYRRVVKHLIGEHRSRISDLNHEAIIIANDLTPSQAATFPRDHVLAFATDSGGLTSHTAIFARALGIPAVVGLERLSEEVEDGDVIIVDGTRGVVILRPTDETIVSYRGHIAEEAAYASSLIELRDLPAVTADGTEIQLHGNIEFADEVPAVINAGGVGIGLFRTEFLWLTSDHEPTEEEQYEEFRTAIELAQGRIMTIRTYDLGADKYTQERALAPERNPFLGCRSIRYCLQNLGMFKRHLRAIMRASAAGPTRIMFPLVTNLLELRQARMILNDVMEDLTEEGIPFDKDIPVGMMVETPAAAVMASSFAREVDFFSIGTNDLVQYILAVDRTNERVASLYSSAHPAVLRTVKDIVRAARRQGIPVSLCGEAAGETINTMLLLGLGLRSLSVVPSRIPYLKQVIRKADMGQCERLARTACSFDSERQVIAYLRDQARKIIPEALGGRSADGDRIDSRS